MRGVSERVSALFFVDRKTYKKSIVVVTAHQMLKDHPTVLKFTRFMTSGILSSNALHSVIATDA